MLKTNKCPASDRLRTKARVNRTQNRAILHQKWHVQLCIIIIHFDGNYEICMHSVRSGLNSAGTRLVSKFCFVWVGLSKCKYALQILEGKQSLQSVLTKCDWILVLCVLVERHHWASTMTQLSIRKVTMRSADMDCVRFKCNVKVLIVNCRSDSSQVRARKERWRRPL